jgi:CheY-like chemotaxis protein
MSSVPAVLVVDDEPTVCRMMARVLSEEGYRVYLAGSGEDALVIACQLGGRLGMVVTDIAMAGMDGIELASFLARLEPAPRVLLISGAGCLPLTLLPGPFLLKPFEPDSLIAQVRAVLGPARAMTLQAAG